MKKGSKMTPEQRKAVSLGHIGIKLSEEAVRKMRLRKHTDATKKKISINNGRVWLGKKFSKKHKKKLRDAHKGVKLSIPHRIALAKARTGAKSCRWQGGISVLNKTERNIIMSHLEYKLW